MQGNNVQVRILIETCIPHAEKHCAGENPNRDVHTTCRETMCR